MGAKKTLNVTSGTNANTGPATAGKTYTHWQVRGSDGTTPKTNPAPLTTPRTVDPNGMLNIVDEAFFVTRGKPTVFTAANSTDRITLVAATAAYSDGQVCTLRNSGGALPAGLSASTVCYLKSLGAGVYELYSDSGLTSKLTFTTDGTGTHSLVIPGQEDDALLVASLAEGAGGYADDDKLYFGTDAAMSDATNIAAFDDVDWNAAAIW